MTQPGSHHRGAASGGGRGKKYLQNQVRLSVDRYQHLAFQFIGSNQCHLVGPLLGNFRIDSNSDMKSVEVT